MNSEAVGPQVWMDAANERRVLDWDEQAPYNRFRGGRGVPGEPEEDERGLLQRGGFRRPVEPAA